MAGVGEASAIVGLINTAATISQAIISIASKYKDAREQIQAFGRDVSIMGKILDQLHRRLSDPSWTVDEDVQLLTDQVIDECINIFTQLVVFKDNLYTTPADVEPARVTLKGKTKWVFKATELDFLRARVDSMKINMVLMMVMAMPRPQTPESAESNSTTTQHVEQIQMLSIQSSACLERLESLEQRMTVDDDPSSDDNDTSSLATFHTTRTSQTIRNTILQLPGPIPCAPRPSLADILPFDTATGIDDSPNTSDLVEDFLQQEEDAANTHPNRERRSSSQESGADFSEIDQRIATFPFSVVRRTKYADLQKDDISKLRFIFILYDPKSGTLEAKSVRWHCNYLMGKTGDQRYNFVHISRQTVSFKIHSRYVADARTHHIDLSRLGYAIPWRICWMFLGVAVSPGEEGVTVYSVEYEAVGLGRRVLSHIGVDFGVKQAPQSRPHS